MEKIRIVFCGCGHRAHGTGQAVMAIDAYETIGVCDPYEDKAVGLADAFEKGKGVRPAVYTDHIKMFDELKPDAVVVVANWEVHVAISIDAMRRGIAVAMEVGGAYDEEECFELVRVYEETKTPFMFLENCCFNKDELWATSLVRNGLFGKVMYCSGAYGHDIRKEVAYGDINRHYRLRNYLTRNCDNYPTHELGPIAKILNINRGNRMLSLVSRASGSLAMHEYVQDKPELAALHNAEFKQGDMVETMITCENGELITIRLDTTLPRLYCREFVVRGTKGLYNENNNMVFLDDGEIDITTNRITFKDGTVSEPLHTFEALHYFYNNAKKYEEEYLPEIWKNVTKEILEQGHGGMDYFEFEAFADCLMNGKEMPIDVYDAVSWMCITYLSERSLKTGMPVEIPDFTNGKYKTRPTKDVIDLPVVKK